MKAPIVCVVVLVASGLLAGCVGFHHNRRCERSSSVAEFLFSSRQEAVEPSLPVLKLPLRVGVAFVPAQGARAGDFSEYQKQQVLERVAKAFEGEKIIESVQLIPTSYLRPQGSFTNLDQVSRMLGVDVVVLLSYDQLQFGSDTLLSLSYWTIVGAYTVHGNKNDTQTMVEAVVYDIGSRSLLFRAPGTHRARHGSSLVDFRENQRRDAARSLDLATDEMLVNLGAELASFKEKVREGRAKVRVEHRPGYSGAGAADGWLLLGLVAAAAAALRLPRGRPAGRVL